MNAMKAEMASIKSLASLMENAMQLLKLWDYLLKEGLTQVLDYVMKVFPKETLVSLAFSDLLVDPTGKTVVDALIKAIHQRYIDEGTDTESVLRVSMYLQELCPKLFDNDDAVTMKVNFFLPFFPNWISSFNVFSQFLFPFFINFFVN